ncbi:response regulator transcription factor [Dichelobacter nodosus]|uniref:Two-component response regulator n=1 Tax=Dichelobacter nodosus (strain VCS1703A) TaxID=246195 RepID=A5EYB4_DICNV|nr:response regulator [Dichelobacter nodosus]ABQ13925.1 two-component response regulator [Dichelobacter nodosus VCS1703A]AXM45670.1 response regulator [Dichelobacter nodosus]KNZ39010.1 response regulator receiver protein [Dichelobacter nodosus]TGA66906.1 response regulator [Dichelobacter nodosus]
MYRLMIVDDSMIIRNKIARLPNDAPFKIVGKAKNGAEAISLCKSLHPDVVTMDLTMPEMDGLECIKSLIEINPKIQILVVSALSDKATGIKALELGANGFLTKPFSDEQLVDALTEMMEDMA